MLYSHLLVSGKTECRFII